MGGEETGGNGGNGQSSVMGRFAHLITCAAHAAGGRVAMISHDQECCLFVPMPIMDAVR